MGTDFGEETRLLSGLCRRGQCLLLWSFLPLPSSSYRRCLQTDLSAVRPWVDYTGAFYSYKALRVERTVCLSSLSSSNIPVSACCMVTLFLWAFLSFPSPLLGKRELLKLVGWLPARFREGASGEFILPRAMDIGTRLRSSECGAGPPFIFP